MLRSVKQLMGGKLNTSDGHVGRVKDVYFDDRSFVIRYLVADTGSWLTGRQVLISPHAVGTLNETGPILPVRLTRKQIEDSPSVDLHKPVSRQYEEEYHRYYGWPYYWQGAALWGMSGFPVLEQASTPFPSHEATPAGSPSGDADAHLRSAQAVNGYHIKARDGLIGHICDFMMDGRSWAIGQLVVKTGHRFSGKELEIPVSTVERISWDESTVFIGLTKQGVEQSPAHLPPPAVSTD